MELNNYKIAIFTRSMNPILFKMLKESLNLPFKHYRLQYTSADGYFYQMLKYDIDYAINIDEDAFIFNNNAILTLLEYCIENKIVNCGMRDGGVLPIRVQNPVVTNPFFSILDLNEIRKEFSHELMNEYRTKKLDYSGFIPESLQGKYFISNDFEPYYPFFLWLNLTKKILYLDVETHADGYTTILKNHKSETMLLHTWWSRKYSIDKFHTERINNIFKECTGIDQKNSKITNYITKIWVLFHQKVLTKTINKVMN